MKIVAAIIVWLIVCIGVWSMFRRSAKADRLRMQWVRDQQRQREAEGQNNGHW